MNITMIGCGVYSMAMAKRLSKVSTNNIKVWSEDPAKVKEYSKSNKIKSIFKDEKFSNNIKLYDKYYDAIRDADIIFIMVASKFMSTVLENMKPYFKADMKIIVGTKGISLEDKKFFSKVIKNTLKTNNIAFISGPSFAIDILNDEILALTVATKKRKIYKDLQKIYKDTNTSLEKTSDVIGVQLAGLLKNIYAIGAGIYEGLGNSNSNRGIYLTKITKEMLHILYMSDCEEMTILSYASLGDTIMTCSNKESRNYSYGITLTSKKKNDAVNYLKNNTVEGHDNLEVMYKMLKKKRIKAPIIYTIYDIVYNNKDAKELEKELLK